MIYSTSITLTMPRTTQPYSLRVVLAARRPGDWIACVESLPVCAAWGTTAPEALARLSTALRAALESLEPYGVSTPLVTSTDALPVIDVTAE